MLVLTRKIGESIVIGDSISVTVLMIQGDKVRIGVDAPKDVLVNRQEVQDRLRKDTGTPAGVDELQRQV